MTTARAKRVRLTLLTFPTRVALVAVSIAAGATVLIHAQSNIDVLAARVAQAQTDGNRYKETGDKKARDASKDALEGASKDLREQLRKTPGCERCYESLVLASCLQSYFEFARNYDGCFTSGAEAAARFPDNGTIALFVGTAQYNRGLFPESARSIKRYIASPQRTPANDAFANEMLKDSQQRFLSGWNTQANYYQSADARITQFNTKTFRNEVVFQVTPEYEMQLGQLGFAELSKAAPAANAPEAAAFLQQLVDKLVSKTPGPNFRYQVTVLDAPDVNAVTPPGHIIVFTGLLRFVDTEAELAGVLSHELAHNYGHHSARRALKTYHVGNLGNAITQAINPKTQAGQLATSLGTAVGTDLFLKAYSRSEEKEADLFGAHLMFNAGYHPSAMSAFFLKLYKANPRTPPRFLSTHPPSPDRADYTSEYLEAFPLDGALIVGSSDAFTKLKALYPSSAGIR